MRYDIRKLEPISPGETLQAEPGTIDLWYYAYERDRDPELIEEQKGLLAPDELQRLGRLRFGRHRRMFIATRALVRTALSAYSDVAPTDWRFESNEHGKPHLTYPSIEPAIHFNLANTRGLVVCAISAAHELVGADAERLDRRSDTVRLADRFFSTAEIEDLHQHPPHEQLEQFFEYWTLKESYIKARGLGLALPLDRFSFFHEKDRIRIEIDDELGDDGSRWRFELLALPPVHMIAVGAATGGTDLSIRASHLVPLR